jgi:hypothetical protein
MRMGLRDVPKSTILAVLCIAIGAAGLLVLGRATGGLLGLGWYFLLALLVVLWNAYAVLRMLGTRASPLRCILSPENAAVVACYVLVLVIWGPLAVYLWESHRAWYAVAYALAAMATAVLLLRARPTRRLRNVLVLVYDVVGALALVAWAACDWNADAGAIPHAAAQSWGLVQASLFSKSALLAPIFILPPVLVLEPRPPLEEEDVREAARKAEAMALAKAGAGVEVDDTDRRRGGPADSPRPRPLWRRVASIGVDTALGAVVVVLILLLPGGLVNVIDWRDEVAPEDADYTSRPGFEFAALGRAFTEVQRAPDDWNDTVAEEVARARELGLDLIRYDVLHELLEDAASLERLDQAIAEIRSAGLDVMLGLPGAGRWEDEHPTFGEMVEVVGADTMLAVERWAPAWVITFIEPNGRSAAALGRTVTVEGWATSADVLGERVHSSSDSTRIMVEVLVDREHSQAPDLVRALRAPGMSIDAIGLSLATLRYIEMSYLWNLCDEARGGAPALWVSSFGAEAAMLGERAQAGAVSDVVLLASGRWNATGLCVRSLLDDTPLPNNFGLVGRDGSPRDSFFALRDAIRAVHWNA